MEVFDVNADIVQYCAQNYKIDPRGLMKLFRTPQSTQAFVKSVYEQYHVNPNLSIVASSCLVVLSGSAALFRKIPNAYVLHVRLPDWAEILFLFNEGFSVCEMAYRLCETMNYFTILPSTTLRMTQADIDAFKGRPRDYIDYTFASRFFNLLKPGRMFIFEEIDQSKIDQILSA